MSGESSRRSNLIDVTYSQLHAILSGHQEGVNIERLTFDYLNHRKDQIGNVEEPFGKPSGASRQKIQSGSITLPDGVTFRIEDADKEFVFAVSSKFQIDEIQAFILLRSFLYNLGLPFTADAELPSMVAELLEAITPFYYSERLSTLRLLIPLFRSKEFTTDPFHNVAYDFLPEAIPDGPKFAQSLVLEYHRKTTEDLPESLKENPKAATQWAKQNMKEQLLLLEVLFWTMWSYVPCSGPLLETIYEAMYATNLGSVQKNDTLLLDQESYQLTQDCVMFWILISLEVLELETVGEDDFRDVGDDTIFTVGPAYVASPESIEHLNDMILNHQEDQYVLTRLAWAYVLSRLAAKAAEVSELPVPYQEVFKRMKLLTKPAELKDREPHFIALAKSCLLPEAKLFPLFQTLLTHSPLFVTAIAWKTGSSVTDPNAIAFRSVLKGVIIALEELVPVEDFSDFNTFIEVWIALFGRSESMSVTAICSQFWQADWRHGIARRAIFDVARSRFPIEPRPLIRLLRAMTGAGFLDTDPLSTADHSQEAEEDLNDHRDICDQFVFHFLQEMPTYSQVIPIGACTGSHALYERLQERGANSPTGLSYVNLRPIKLPGGSTLPARSTGRLLSGDGGDYIVVCWKHDHSGWKLLLELLTGYVNRKQMNVAASGFYQDVDFRRGTPQPLTLGIEDTGIEMQGEGEEEIVTDILDLVRSLIQGNPREALALMEAFEAGEPVVSHTMTESQPPDLVQLTTMILEEALSRSDARARSGSRTNLITSAMSVLSALLAIPTYSNRVWLYIRSTSVLFGSERSAGFASVALASERATGHYTMTLALLYLVQQLFREASSTVLPESLRLQQLKEEVLLRAARFVHSEIWVEHLGWKYAQLGDRFEIGRRVTSLYVEVLEHAPPALDERPFLTLSQTVADILLFKATTSTINPLVSSISSGGHILRMLYASRRFGDARRLIYLLQSHLRLIRLVLTYKQKSSAASRLSLLEQTLCARVTGGAISHDSTHSKLDSIDMLASYLKNRDVGNVVPLEAIRVLYALCSSLSTTQPSPPTIIGHLSNPEATVGSLVHIVQHPYDDLALRNAIWNFIALAIDKEPALASLFVTGEFHTPASFKKEGEKSNGEKANLTNVMGVARDLLTNWKEIWESNPQLLASVFKFLDVVWQHGLEHKTALKPLRNDAEFWDEMVLAACEEVGPVPDYETSSYLIVDGIQHSSLHDAVAMHSYRTMVKSYAVHIIGLDIDIYRQLYGSDDTPPKPLSFVKIEAEFKIQDQLMDLLSEAASSSYAPHLHDQLVKLLQDEFAGLTVEQLKSQEPLPEREYGDSFAFSVLLLRSRLHAYPHKLDEMENPKDVVEKHLLSINLNLSLAHSQAALAESWEFLLRQVIPYMRANVYMRPILLSIAASISYSLAAEQRSGDMMATIHATRLSLLLTILEVAWFSSTDKPGEIQSFMELVRNLHGIILNEAQSPARSFLGTLSAPFHRILLQVIYFCSRHSRSMIRRPKALNAEQRLTIAAMVDAAINLVVDALRIVFVSARSRMDVDLDRDMQLLVSVFELCTHSDLTPSSTMWLSRCQETDIIRASLDLYVHIDLVGLSDIPLLLSRKQPLYAPHILLFHMALVCNHTSAERLASEGVLTAYSNNSISAAISAGIVAVSIPELPGERSPAHLAYCSMLGIVATVISELGKHNHYFDAEACGFVQFYGDQITRALSWTIGDSITFPLVEEIEQVVNLFYSIAASTPAAANSNPIVDKVLKGFTTYALLLLQQLNYAVTHPNHLASLLEPVTNEERASLEREMEQMDPYKRPLVTRLIHRLYKIASNVVGTLLAVSKADVVLLGAHEDWSLGEALIIPHSKVVLGEAASIGTLLELGNSTLDVLKDLVARPVGQSLIPLSSAPANPQSSSSDPDVRQGILTARRSLEKTLMYAVTQLAMWLSKPEYEASAPSDVDDDSMDAQSSHRPLESVKERRTAPRGSITLAERLRRGMTAEMTGDLQALLNKARPLMERSASVIGSKDVDLTPILLNFLQERIGVPL